MRMTKSPFLLRGDSDSRIAETELQSIRAQIAAAKGELADLNARRTRAMLDLSLADDRITEFRCEAIALVLILGAA
jgi:hypothetical protein